MNEKRKQVALQCRAVAHMAQALAKVYADKERMFLSDTKGPDDIIDIVGKWSASHMEDLGNILNGIDAADSDEDAWMEPVFLEAQRLYPAA